MSSLQELLSSGKKKLKPSTTYITTLDGTKLVEKDIDGERKVIEKIPHYNEGFVIDMKPDLIISEIIDGLFIGSQDVAHDLIILKGKNITHIINVATGIINNFEKMIIYLNVDALDTPEFSLIANFDKCSHFIDDAINGKGNVLVHCNAGISRSSTIVIAYIMKKCNKTFTEAFDVVKSKRPFIRPNSGFIEQLKIYERYCCKR